MRHRLIRGIVAGGITATLALVAVPSAEALHLFPLTPVFDPLGHDCAQALSANPGGAGGQVGVFGFDFTDAGTNDSVTHLNAGDRVTWTWNADHCHSVTFDAGPTGGPAGTSGAAGFQPAQPQLVRPGPGGNTTFTLSFPSPGVYEYRCVHHASLGMTGTVMVH